MIIISKCKETGDQLLSLATQGRRNEPPPQYERLRLAGRENFFNGACYLVQARAGENLEMTEGVAGVPDSLTVRSQFNVSSTLRQQTSLEVTATSGNCPDLGPFVITIRSLGFGVRNLASKVGQIT